MVLNIFVLFCFFFEHSNGRSHLIVLLSVCFKIVEIVIYFANGIKLFYGVEYNCHANILVCHQNDRYFNRQYDNYDLKIDSIRIYIQ